MGKQTVEKSEFTYEKDLEDKPFRDRELQLPYRFTEEELQEKSNELAGEITARQRLEDDKKETMSNFKARIDKKTANINLLASQVTVKHETRPIHCWLFLNQPIEGQKTIVRSDTKEIVRIEEMEQHEFQEELNLENPTDEQENAELQGAEDNEESPSEQAPADEGETKKETSTKSKKSKRGKIK